MNITTQTATSPLATVVNPPTDNLRRENSQREIISQPTPTHQSAAEKGVASDRERGRTPAQNNEQIDFSAIQENAEKENSTINDANDHERGNSQSADQDQAKNAEQKEQNGEEDSVEVFREQQEIRQLQKRDQEVRSHEQAHDAAGGAYTSSPTYGYEVGPDGKKYAVTGEVSVDLSPIEGNPRATIAKMQKVRTAALAPANPSIQDTKVAASAQAIILQAQQSLQSVASTESENSVDSAEGVRYTGNTDIFRADAGDTIESENSSNEFDQFIGQTLSSQEQISPTRNEEIAQRATRIETYYANINQAYDQSPKFQFELTA
ncbi:putative metalloprotease CJM1_0395 family protein [Thalassotalea atypica]|uniref:putative metalloprotease CJM1_0395 family protein n=1 Tax=Thalassotalea atypica TaxID=2054316 RepID=UPI0025744C57|nr:putative metalloprotease CJM1_0395 family protein [Thalassotalea atypica]